MLRLVVEGPQPEPISPIDFGYQPQRFNENTADCIFVDLRLLLQDPQKAVPQRGNLAAMSASLLKTLREKVYLFGTRRLAHLVPQLMPATNLAQDASNLSSVLDQLQRNHARFDRFNNLVREVLPDIQRVSVRSNNPPQGEVVIWSHDPKSEREDLAVRLADCGTGVAHVIAMLAVLSTTPRPHVVMIDEPQSYLHPSAVRRLISIFKKMGEYQFILTTHASEVIVAADPSTVTLVKRSGETTSLETVDMRINASQRVILEELGASFSDVFGAESILWVEGQTEEICFPRILARISNRTLRGSVVKALRATGDLMGKRATLVLEIYERLSSGVGLVPPSIGFVFDREDRTDQEMANLTRRSEGRAHFLGKRMFENYLLHPIAIASIINSSLPKQTAIEPERVSDEIDALRADGAYFKPLPLVHGPDWEDTINGGKLLTELFRRLGPLDYRKTEHSVALASWLLENESAVLSDIATQLNKILTA